MIRKTQIDRYYTKKGGSVLLENDNATKGNESPRRYSALKENEEERENGDVREPSFHVLPQSSKAGQVGQLSTNKNRSGGAFVESTWEVSAIPKEEERKDKKRKRKEGRGEKEGERRKREKGKEKKMKKEEKSHTEGNLYINLCKTN